MEIAKSTPHTAVTTDVRFATFVLEINLGLVERCFGKGHPQLA